MRAFIPLLVATMFLAVIAAPAVSTTRLATGTRSNADAAVCGIPGSLDFGDVAVGSTLERPFQIRNNGTERLDGYIYPYCDDFVVIRGYGPFLLDPGEAHDVLVRFRPLTSGSAECMLDILGTCSGIRLTGNGVGEEPFTVDLLPGKCPNRVQVNRGGVIRIAVMGSSGNTTGIDEIDPATIRIAGPAGSAWPLRTRVQDVSSPGSACACGDGGRDGVVDLVATFDLDDLLNAVGFPPATVYDVIVVGNLLDGTFWQARDCIELAATGSGKGLRTPTGISITSDGSVDPARQKVNFRLDERAEFNLQLFDIRGRLIRELARQHRPAGDHTLEWDAGGLAGGVYFYRLNVGRETATTRLILLR